MTVLLNALDERERILGALYKHRGIAKDARNEIDMSEAKFRKACADHHIDLKAFKEFIKDNPEFADVMAHYGTQPPAHYNGQASMAAKEATIAAQRPTDGRSVADVESVTRCPSCNEGKKHDNRTFGLGLFMERVFFCGSRLNRHGHHIRTNKCVRIEERRG